MQTKIDQNFPKLRSKKYEIDYIYKTIYSKIESGDIKSRSNMCTCKEYKIILNLNYNWKIIVKKQTKSNMWINSY